MKQMKKNYYSSEDKMKFKNKIITEYDSKTKNEEKLMQVLFW